MTQTPTRERLPCMSYVRSNIAAMAGYRPGEQPRAGKFIKLNTNENPYPPSERVADAIRACLERGLGRYPDPVATSFRVRAGEVLGVPPEWILCGNGSDDILTVLTRAFVGEGQLLRLPYPSYVLYRTLAEIQGARYEEVQFTEDWSLSDAFSEVRDDLKLVCLANPNSPSGTVVSPDRILEIADRLSCPLLVDEAYADFADTNCIDLVAQNSKIMVSRSLSKAYSLAGLRFGYVVAQEEMISQLNKVKDSYNCDSLSIAGATAAIDDQGWRESNRSKVIATRARMSDELGQLGFSLTPSQANFVWCTHPDKPLEPVYGELRKHRILVRYMNYESWGDGLRITVGTDDQVDACLAVLETLM